jgi:hypothetical protein
MAKQTVQTTDTLNVGRGKINDNFTELYDSTNVVENSTITALTSSDLNTAYPSAPNGFRVVAPLIVGSPLLYTKVGAGWISTAITVL